VPFFQVDDQLPANAKVRRLLDDNPTHGLAAVGLWTLAGATVQAGLTDGVVSLTDLTRITLDKAKAKRLASLLVAGGLWHEAGHACESCPEIAPGTYLFHDWWDLGYATGAKVKLARDRRRELRDPAVRAAVHARDGDTCRYCGKTVNFNDRRSDRGGTIDHVLPGLARGAGNLVVACLKCNRHKAQRTPEQAGMVLRPPPTNPTDLGTDLEHELDRELESGCPPARARARRHGVGPGQGQGKKEGEARSGAGPAGPAPAVDTPDTFGSPFYPHRPPPGSEDVTCEEHQLPEPCRKCAAQPDHDGRPW